MGNNKNKKQKEQKENEKKKKDLYGPSAKILLGASNCTKTFIVAEDEA